MTDLWIEQFEERMRERQKQRDTVTLSGVELEVKPSIAPEVAMRYQDFWGRFAEFSAKQKAAADAGKPPPPTPDEFTDAAVIDLLEDTVRACITADSFPKWRELRSPYRDVPLNWSDIVQVCVDLIARAGRHPTDGPSGSSDGPTTNGASSKAASSSRAAKQKT